ncbi:MAG TPA: SRPBCC family protein [Verrucomicrobiae bacterium]|nr:SRPBCC family protein [Verrucomicrobiae bacterium]
MIEAESSIEIGRPAAEVFAFIDDFTKAAEWLESCVELRQTSVAPRAEGATLAYSHRQGGGGRMEGVVTGYQRDRRLSMKFTDPQFDVAIDFRLEPATAGTTVTHACAVEPKGALAKMMAPMIRSMNERQVESNLSRLKALVENRG